jgi:hypothetical protein
MYCPSSCDLYPQRILTHITVGYKRQFQTLHEKMENTRIRYARVCKPQGHQGRRSSLTAYSEHRSACCGKEEGCRIPDFTREAISRLYYTRRWRMNAFAMLGSVSHMGIKVFTREAISKVYTRRRIIHAFYMLGFVSHMGIKVDQDISRRYMEPNQAFTQKEAVSHNERSTAQQSDTK